MQLSKQYGFTGRASCGLSSGFALPVSAQIKADSALLRAAAASLIALTEPRRRCGASGVCAVLPPAAAQPLLPPHPRPPLIMSIFFPLRTEVNFYSNLSFLSSFFLFGRLMPLLFFFFLKEVFPLTPRKAKFKFRI